MEVVVAPVDGDGLLFPPAQSSTIAGPEGVG